jgi:hypothetical protein
VSDQTTPPTIEAVIRSPIGEVRVWIDAEGAPRTSIVCEYMSGREAFDAGQQMAAVMELASNAVRGLVGRAQPFSAPLSAPPLGIARWVDERCVMDRTARVQSITLYEDYAAWAEGQSGRPLTMRGFADALSESRFPIAGKDRYGRKLRSGLRLKPAHDGEARPVLRVAG